MLNSRPSHAPAGLLLVAAALAFVAGLVVPAALAGCAGLTQAEAAMLDGAVAAACPEESMIPVVGAELAMACPAEVAAVKALVSANTIAPGTTVVHTATAKKLVRTRGGKTGCIGIVVPRIADAGPDAALPSGPAVLPVPSDGGVEGGR